MQTEKVKSLCDRMKIPYPLPLGQDAVISGSFMWHVLTAGQARSETDEKTNWLPNDIDVFCTLSAVPRFREYFYKHGFKLAFVSENDYVDEEYRLVEEWALPSAPTWASSSEPNSTILQSFQNFCKEKNLPPLPENTLLANRKENCHVQLIIAPSPSASVEKAANMIVGKFDFPTLESYFDGENTVVTYPTEVLERVSAVRDKKYKDEKCGAPSRRQDRLKKRIEKYRGYSLNFPSLKEEVSSWLYYLPSAKEAKKDAEIVSQTVWTEKSSFPPTLDDAKFIIANLVRNSIAAGETSRSVLIEDELVPGIKKWLFSHDYIMCKYPVKIKYMIGRLPAHKYLISWEN